MVTTLVQGVLTQVEVVGHGITDDKDKTNGVDDSCRTVSQHVFLLGGHDLHLCPGAKDQPSTRISGSPVHEIQVAGSNA